MAQTRLPTGPSPFQTKNQSATGYRDLSLIRAPQSAHARELTPSFIPPMRYKKLTNKPFKWGIKFRVNSPERLFWIKRANETSAPTYLHDRDRAPPEASGPSLHLAMYVAFPLSEDELKRWCTNCLALSQATPHCQRLLVVSLVKISQAYHAFLLRSLKHWEGAATTSSSMKGAAFPAKHLGPQPLKNIQFWRNRSKNKLANWRRE